MNAYVINLPDAAERREHVQTKLAAEGIDMVLVEAVLGRALELPHPDYDETAYRLRHGKRTNLSELGCYFSHIKALGMFLESGHEHALILEDDVDWSVDLRGVLDAALAHAQRFDLLRLEGTHSGSPVKVADMQNGFSLCCNLSRYTGSGAYLVNRKAAAAMVDQLRPMRLPYDHAFDREWTFGITALSLRPAPIHQRKDFGSQIVGQTSYKSFKLPLRYFTVLPYRAFNELSRFVCRSLTLLKQKGMR
ncbi:glycosyltransferase family 25 protein [Pontiella sp.]|uniref:glycosyltransferase family 25 protein n=1 Tax=Pontiella sp. TaxID=2837462 RepID=UPI00356A63B4